VFKRHIVQVTGTRTDPFRNKTDDDFDACMDDVDAYVEKNYAIAKMCLTHQFWQKMEWPSSGGSDRFTKLEGFLGKHKIEYQKELESKKPSKETTFTTKTVRESLFGEIATGKRFYRPEMCWGWAFGDAVASKFLTLTGAANTLTDRKVDSEALMNLFTGESFVSVSDEHAKEEDVEGITVEASANNKGSVAFRFLRIANVKCRAKVSVFKSLKKVATGYSPCLENSGMCKCKASQQMQMQVGKLWSEKRTMKDPLIGVKCNNYGFFGLPNSLKLSDGDGKCHCIQKTASVLELQALKGKANGARIVIRASAKSIGNTLNMMDRKDSFGRSRDGSSLEQTLVDESDLYQLKAGSETHVDLNTGTGGFELLFTDAVTDREFDCKGTTWVDHKCDGPDCAGMGRTRCDAMKKQMAKTLATSKEKDFRGRPKIKNSYYSDIGGAAKRPSLRVYLASWTETKGSKVDVINKLTTKNTVRDEIGRCKWSYKNNIASIKTEIPSRGLHNALKKAKAQMTQDAYGGLRHVCYIDFGCEHAVDARWSSRLGTFGINSVHGPWDLEKFGWKFVSRMGRYPTPWPTTCKGHGDICTFDNAILAEEKTTPGAIMERNQDVWKVTEKGDMGEEYLYKQPRTDLFGCRVNKPTQSWSDHAITIGDQQRSARLPQCATCVTRLQKFENMFRWYISGESRMEMLKGNTEHEKYIRIFEAAMNGAAKLSESGTTVRNTMDAEGLKGKMSASKTLTDDIGSEAGAIAAAAGNEKASSLIKGAQDARDALPKAIALKENLENPTHKGATPDNGILGTNITEYDSLMAGHYEKGSEGIDSAATLIGGNIKNAQVQEYVSLGSGILKCALGIGVAAATAGQMYGVAVSSCVPFLAKTIATYLRKSLIKELSLKPSPPPFLNELKWTELYLKEMSSKAFGQDKKEEEDGLALVSAWPSLWVCGCGSVWVRCEWVWGVGGGGGAVK